MVFLVSFLNLLYGNFFLNKLGPILRSQSSIVTDSSSKFPCVVLKG